MKLVGKKEKQKISEKKSLPWNMIIGTIVGLGIGVGLSFITDCYNGNWIGYSSVVVFILFGAWLGYWVGKNNGLKLLFHDDVYYRVGGYVAFGLILFLCTWALFFFVVKKSDLMYDSFVVQKLFKQEINNGIGTWGTKVFGETWKIAGKEYKVAEAVGIWGNVFWFTLKYFLNHMVFVIPFIFLMNYIKIGKWNLSVIYFALYTIMWGAVVGTNSLTFPVGENPMAGPLVVFARYGLWVWFSYLLLMTSTSQMACLVAPKWTEWEWKKEGKFWPISFTPDQKEVFIYGLLFLLASSFAEARIFVYYNF